MGGLLGLTITFALSGRLDGIPADTPLAWRRVIPTVSTRHRRRTGVSAPAPDGRAFPDLRARVI